jgi:hypothetical protein
VAGETHDRQLWPNCLEFTGRNEATHPGHRQVHHHDIDVVDAATLDRFGTVAGLAGDRQIGFSVDQELQSLTNRFVIFH